MKRIIVEIHVELNGNIGGYNATILSSFSVPSPIITKKHHIDDLSELAELIKNEEGRA